MVRTRHLLGPVVGLLCCCPVAAQEKPDQDPQEKEPKLVKVATLGASTRAPSKEEVKQLDLKFEVRARGQVVSDVEKDSAAGKAGIEAGDVLVKLGAVELFSQDDIADVLRVSKPGKKLEAVVLRAKTLKEEKVSVSLGAKEMKAPEKPRLEWQFASLASLADAVAKAKKEKKLVLVGLSGAET